MTCGASATTETHGGMIPCAMQTHQLAVMQAVGLNKSLNEINLTPRSLGTKAKKMTNSEDPV
jgi:hypothetical protein